MHSPVRFLCLILFVVLLLWPAAGSRAQDIVDLSDRDALLKKDPRLARKVTFVQKEARVGELLDAIARQTGIEISAGERDGSDAELITACVRDLPAVDLMTSLWSLLSYRTGTWVWQRHEDAADKQNPIAYRFSKTPAARELSSHTRTVIEDYFERMFEAKRLAVSGQASSSGANKNEEFPEVAGMDDRTRSKEAAFFSQFSSAESLNLARGSATQDNPLTLPRSQWTPATTAYVDAEMALIHGPDPDHKNPQPQNIRLYKNRASNDEVTPTLWFVMDLIGGPSVAGSFRTEKLWRDRLAADWVLPGDATEDDEKGSLAVAAPPKSALQSEVIPGGIGMITPTTPRPAVDQLVSLYERSGVPLLAHLYGSQMTVKPLLKETTVGEAVAKLHAAGNSTGKFFWLKWRSGVLLVTYPGVIVAADALQETYAPWQPIKAFRAQVAADPDDAPSFAALCALAARLTVPQMNAISKQRDLMQPAGSYVTGDRDTGRWLGINHVILAEMDRLPKVRQQAETATGIPVRYLPRAMRDEMQAALGETPPSEVSFRIRTENTPPWSPKGRTDQNWTRGRRWRLQLFEKAHPELTLRENIFDWYTHPRSKPSDF